MSKRWNETRGFTLIEATAMLFVLTFGVMGAIQMHIVAIEKTRALQEYGVADEVLQNEIETLRALPFEAIAVGSGQPLRSATPALERLTRVQATVDIVDQSAETPGLKQVCVKVRWIGEHGRSIERSVETLIARKR